MKKKILFVLAALVLSGCATPTGEVSSEDNDPASSATPSSEITKPSSPSSSEKTSSEDDFDYGDSSQSSVEEEKPSNDHEKSQSEMIVLLEGTLANEVTSQSHFKYAFTRKNLPYNVKNVYETGESFEEKSFQNCMAVATGTKKSKTTEEGGKIAKDLSVNYLKKFDSDDTYFYQIKDYDSDTTDYGFTDTADKVEKSSLTGDELIRAKGDFISAYALDLIHYLFPSTSPTLTTLPTFKETEEAGKKTYVAKATASLTGSDSAGSYKENYYYEMTLVLDEAGRVTSVKGKKSWQYRLDSSTSTEPDKYQYDDYAYSASYDEKEAAPSSNEDLNVLDYFLVSYTGIKLVTFKDTKYVEIDPKNADRGVYISSAYATGYSPAKSADIHLIPVRSSNEEVVRLDTSINNFYINATSGSADLTFRSVTGVEKTITVTVSEEKLVPTTLPINAVSRSKFMKYVQDYGTEKFIYTGRKYEGLKINILQKDKYDDRIDTISSNDEIASIEETSTTDGGSFTSHVYSVTPKKEGKVTLGWYAKQDHNVKQEFNFTVKKGLSAEELKTLLVGSTWSFNDAENNQTIEIGFTDKKATFTSILPNETNTCTATYSLNDYKISFGTWETADGEEALCYSTAEMSIAGDNIRFYQSSGSVQQADIFLKKA